ncbi:MAG TPA: DUF86 domain-containing protein [Mycobacteriales bacterium]|nr:DUF86 domain-containing protein [Mycobacteriales bacterium]
MSADLRERYDDMPWRTIIGFRNVAVHEYFAVEWQVVWQIVDRQLPALIDYGLAILRTEYPELVAGL